MVAPWTLRTFTELSEPTMSRIYRINPKTCIVWGTAGEKCPFKGSDIPWCGLYLEDMVASKYWNGSEYAAYRLPQCITEFGNKIEETNGNE